MVVSSVSRNILSELTSATGTFRTNVSQLQAGNQQFAQLGGVQLAGAARAFDLRISGINLAANGIVQGLRTVDAAATGLDTAKNLLTQARTLARQAADPTTTAAQRATIQTQLNSINTQLDTNARNTTLDGRSLLNGSSNRITVTTGTAGQSSTVVLTDASARGQGLGHVDVTTQTGASDAARQYDQALTRVTSARSGLDSAKSRLESAGIALEGTTDALVSQQGRLNSSTQAVQTSLSIQSQLNAGFGLFSQNGVTSGSVLRLFGFLP